MVSENLIRVILIAAIFIFSGCAVSNRTDQLSSNYKGAVYDKIFIVGYVDGMSDTISLEEHLFKSVYSESTEIFLSHKEVDFTRARDADSFNDAAVRLGADAVLIVSPKLNKNNELIYEAILGDLISHTTVWISQINPRILQGGFTRSQNVSAIFQTVSNSVAADLRRHGVIR